MTSENPTFKDFLYDPKYGYYNKLPTDPYAHYLNSISKADVPMTYSASTTWFDPVYLGRLYLEGLSRSTKAFSALTKTTYQEKGDSYQNVTADIAMAAAGPLGNILETGALYGTTAVPALVDVNQIYPAILRVDWTNTDVAAAMSTIQTSRRTPSLEQIRDYMSRKFWDAVDMQLCGVYNDYAAAGDGTNQTGYGVDSVASAGGAVMEFENIDRMITSTADGGTATYVSHNTDGDIYWNSTGVAGTKRFDRNAGEGVCNVRLPTGGSAAAGEAYNICDELDDLMAQCLVYAEEPYNYIAMMSPKAYNKIKAENDPKAIITDYTDARQTVGGISSTPGVVGGKVQLSALRLSDITVPIVTVPYLMGTKLSSWLWKNTKHTTGGAGNIFLINQDAMEFRTLIPLTYKSNPMESGLETKHTLFMAGQLIAKNWLSHGALKLISS